MLEKLYKIAEQENLTIEFDDLIPPYAGIYLSAKHLPPKIVISKHIRNIAFLRCILAEELGHHFTSVGMAVVQSYFVYHDQINICKTEHRALKWAAEHLVPIAELKKAIRIGIVHTWELAEHFTITQPMMEFRLQLNDVKKLYPDNAQKVEKHYF